MTTATLICWIAFATGLYGYWAVDQGDGWNAWKLSPVAILIACAAAYRGFGDAVGHGYVIFLALATVFLLLAKTNMAVRVQREPST